VSLGCVASGLRRSCVAPGVRLPLTHRVERLVAGRDSVVDPAIFVVEDQRDVENFAVYEVEFVFVSHRASPERQSTDGRRQTTV
jgi:hypothetical protein